MGLPLRIVLALFLGEVVIVSSASLESNVCQEDIAQKGSAMLQKAPSRTMLQMPSKVSLLPSQTVGLAQQQQQLTTNVQAWLSLVKRDSEVTHLSCIPSVLTQIREIEFKKHEAATEAATTPAATEAATEAGTTPAATEGGSGGEAEPEPTEAATEAAIEAATPEPEPTEAATEAPTTPAATDAATEAATPESEPEPTEAATEAATTQAATEAAIEAATEAATTPATTEAVTEAATTPAATEAATEAATTPAATEAATEAATTPAATEAATEAATTPAATEAATEAASEAAATPAATEAATDAPIALVNVALPPGAASGATASLDAAGFLATTNLCCPVEMETFFNRLLDSMGFDVCSKPHVQGLVHWFHCVPSMDFASVTSVISNGNPCKYWSPKGIVCPILSGECEGKWCR